MPEDRAGSYGAIERDVRAALAADPRTAHCATQELKVQPGGLSNHAWTAQAGSERWFIRLSPPDPERLGVDRTSECVLLEAAAAAGLAPPLVRCDPGRRLLVTRCIDGVPLQRLAAVAPRNIERLAGLLRRLHSLTLPARVAIVDFARQARHLEEVGDCTDALARDMRAVADEALAVMSRSVAARTLCHNDLHHLNLVDDGARLWLVDWEYGGAGDPAFDLASFFCQHECDAAARERFLAAYAGGPEIAVQRLDAACIVFDYVQWLWYRVSLATGPSPGSVYEERAKALVRRLLDARF